MSSPLAEAFLMDSLNSCYETPSKSVGHRCQHFHIFHGTFTVRNKARSKHKIVCHAPLYLAPDRGCITLGQAVLVKVYRSAIITMCHIHISQIQTALGDIGSSHRRNGAQRLHGHHTAGGIAPETL